MYFPLKLLPGPVFTKVHVEPSIKGESKICFNGHASVTKITAIPIDVENHLKIFRSKKALKLSLSMELWMGNLPALLLLG